MSKVANALDKIVAFDGEGVVNAHGQAHDAAVDLADLLVSLHAFLNQYIVFPHEEQSLVIALWIVHTWVVKAFDVTPYLSVASPVKRCGKSTLLDCLNLFCRASWQAVSPTSAVLYRKIEQDCPTLFLDEVDTIFTASKADEGKEELRAVLNAGFHRGAKVPRCVGPTHQLVEFGVFCPKAIAGIGKLLGFRSLADGSFVPGFLLAPFRDGGVVMLDEIDTGDPGVLASLNALLANGHYLFPDGVEVARHPNFRVIAGANTKGVGAVAGYTARNRIDAATLDRFAVIELLPDAGLELALVCGGKNESQPWTCAGPLAAEKAEGACRSWVRWVQKVRASAGASVLISPRASLLGAAALRAGIPVAEVAEALVFKLVSPDTRRNLLAVCGQPGC